MTKSALFLFFGALLLVGALWGPWEITLPGDFREPRCQPRSLSEPGRLNIDTSAKLYGFARPCESYLEFYIAKNTSLRSFDGKVMVFGPHEEMLLERNIHVELAETEYGMLHTELPVDPVKGHDCSQLTLRLSSLKCRDNRGDSIDCPSARVKTSMVFQDFLLDDANLNICFDD